MKKLFLAALLVLAPTLGWAQCSGQFPNQTVCGNVSGTANFPRSISLGAVAAGSVSIKTPVDVATTANITLSGEQTIDGFLTSASRVLVKNQTTSSQNGIYLSAAGAWTRTTDFNAVDQVVRGTTVLVTQGNTNAGSLFAISAANPITIGTSNITFELAPSVPIDFCDGVTDYTTKLQAALDTGKHLLFKSQSLCVSGALTGSTTGQKLVGVYSTFTSGFKNAGIDFGTTAGSGLTISAASNVIDGLHIKGASRSTGPTALIKLERTTGTQPDLDLTVKDSFLSGASKLVHINGRGLFIERTAFEDADYGADIEFPSDVGTPTNFGNTVTGGARKYVFIDNYDHMAGPSGSAFVRVNGTNKDLVYGVYIANTVIDNATLGHKLFDGHLNFGLIENNYGYRMTGEAIVLRGCNDGTIRGNKWYGASTDATVDGFAPSIMTNGLSVPAGSAGPFTSCEFSNNTVSYNNRPMVDINTNMDFLKLDGNHCYKCVLSNGTRTDSIFNIASGVTIGQLLFRNNSALIDTLANNASAGFLKATGATVTSLDWGSNTINAASNMPLSVGITVTQTFYGGIIVPTVNGNTITTGTGTLTLGAGSTLATSATNSITLTSTGATNVTLPTTGTLATLAGAEELDNKTLDASIAKGTWTTSGTWTVPAHTLAGTISGGGNQINNVIIGTSTPLAGNFTTSYSTTNIIGGTTATPQVYSNSATPFFQVNTTASNSGMGASRWNNSVGGPIIPMFKSRGAAVGTRGIVSSGDLMGRFWFEADDGVSNILAAQLGSIVEGTPGVDDIGGAITISTRPTGAAASLTERMRVANTGVITALANVASTTSTTGTLVVTGGGGFSGDIFAGATINAGTTFSAGGSAGLSKTYTMRDAAGTGTCTIITTGGIATGGTC